MLWWWKRKLQSDDPAVRLHALEKIAAHGDGGGWYLMQAAEDPDDDVATCAVEHLGWLREATDITPLLEQYGDAVYPEGLLLVIRGVGRTGDVPAAKGLLEAIGRCWNIYNPSLFVKALVESLCHAKGEAALVSLLESDEDSRVLRALEEIGTAWHAMQGVQNWLERLADRVAAGDDDAGRTLERIDPDWQDSQRGKVAIDGLLSLLDGTEQERSRAVYLLSEMNVAEAIASVIRVLVSADTGSECRVEIADALARMETPQAMLDLMEALAGNEKLARSVTEERLGAAEIQTLAQMARGQAPVQMTTSLAGQALDGNFLVRRCAFVALAGDRELWAESESSQKRIVELVRELGDRTGIADTAPALAATGDEAAIPVLLVSLERASDDDEKIAIIQALKDLDESQVPAEDLVWFEDATTVANEETAEADYAEEDENSRERVLHLHAVLRGETGMFELPESTAREALGMLGDLPAGAEVSAWVPGGTTLQEALEAAAELAQIGTARAIGALIDSIETRNPELAVGIAKQLSRIAPTGTDSEIRDILWKLEYQPSGLTVAECRSQLRNIFRV